MTQHFIYNETMKSKDLFSKNIYTEHIGSFKIYVENMTTSAQLIFCFH